MPTATAVKINLADNTLAGNSAAVVAALAAAGMATTATQAASIAAAVVGLFDYKGNLDCSANPNYPAASKGDVYRISVAGKVGGASGEIVSLGDFVTALADNAGGTEASVGTSWEVSEANIPGITAAGLAILQAADAAAQVALLAAVLHSYTAVTIGASGDSTPTLASPHHTQVITLSGATTGDGARVSLATTGRVAGDKVKMPVSFAADASRLRVYNATTGGTLLLDQTNDGTARLFCAEFTYTGSAWTLSQGAYYA